jgi:hypothetical protein
MDMLVDSVPCSNYVNGISLQEVPPLNLTQLDEDDTKGVFYMLLNVSVSVELIEII